MVNILFEIPSKIKAFVDTYKACLEQRYLSHAYYLEYTKLAMVANICKLHSNCGRNLHLFKSFQGLKSQLVFYSLIVAKQRDEEFLGIQPR
jgi:hypothetical protein